jgi:hypothetical protein
VVGEILRSASALAVGLATDEEGVARVGEPVAGGAGEQRVADRLRPRVEGAVAGQDQGLALVARTDQRVEIVGQLRGEWAEADVVEREQIDRAEAAGCRSA